MATKTGLSTKLLISRFEECFPKFNDFIKVYYHDSTDREVENVCQSIIGIKWLQGGWQEMNSIKQLFVNEFLPSSPIYKLNHYIEKGSLPKINYAYKTIGEAHQPKWSCHISIDDKLIVKSKGHSIKNDAKVEAAEKVLLLFDEGKL